MKYKYFLYSILIHIVLIALLIFVTCPVKDIKNLKTDISVSFIQPDIEPEKKEVINPIDNTQKQPKIISSNIPEKINNTNNTADILDNQNPDMIEDIPAVKPSINPSDDIIENNINKQTSDLVLPDKKKSLLSDKSLQDNSSFKIEGDLKNRKIIYKILPKPVSDLKEEISLKYKLVVDGTGNIIDIIPIKKGNLQAEKNTITALKQWKFNKLPDIEKDSLQRGIITIYFKLK